MKAIRVASVLLLAVIALALVPHAASQCGPIPGKLSTIISASEPWYCPINQQIYSQWTKELPLAYAAVLIAFLIAAIIFMSGVALNSSRIKNFAMGEFYEAIASAVIVGSFIYLCAVVFGALPGIFVGSINPYATAFNLMRNTISTGEQAYTVIYNVYLSMSFITSPTITVQIGGDFNALLRSAFNFLEFAPQLFVNIYTIPVTIFFLDPAKAISGFLVDGILALYAEYYLLEFFSIAAIPAFLVPGVLLRSIFPTRALGGLMIALAFGFYLIMPSLFAVAYYFTAPTVQRDMGQATLQLSSLTYTSHSVISQNSPLVLQLENVKTSLNGFWLLIFFYPGLISAMTYAAIIEISRFIGRAPARVSKLRRLV